jgi:hypothetical protein
MPMYVQQPGVFVQPPPTGTVQGPVESTTVEGATITFPEVRMRFPSIRFPSVSRSRQNARMILDQQAAPYVEGPTVPVMPTQAVPAAAVPAAAVPVAAPAAAQAFMAAPQMMMAQAAPQMVMQAAPQMAMPQMAMPQAAPQMMMAQPMMMAAPMMAQPQYYLPQRAVPQQTVPQNCPTQQAEPNYAPARAAPSCDARASAEEKIRQLELVEQQLKQRMDALRRQIEQVEMRPPTPTPDLGAQRALQQPAPQPLRPVGIQPVSQPIYQPISQPRQQPTVQPVQPTQAIQPVSRIYSESPAAYISEPQYLPPPVPQYPQPQYAAPSQVIREPQAATATITGLRAR